MSQSHFSSCVASLSIHQNEDLQYAAISTGILSLFGSSFMLLTLIKYGNFTSKFHNHCIFFIALSDYIWNLSMVANYGSLLAGWRGSGLTGGDLSWTCFFREIFQFFSCTSIAWTLIFAVFLAKSFSPDSDKVSYKTYLPAHLFCWGFGFIITIILAIFRDPTNPRCFPDKKLHLFVWGGYILIAFLISIIVYNQFSQNFPTIFFSYCYIFRMYIVTVKSVPALRKTNVPLRLSLYLLVFMITWCCDFIGIIYHFLIGTDCENFPLAFAGFFTINLGGALNCVVYGVTNRSLHKHESRSRLLFQFIGSPLLLPPVALAHFIKYLGGFQKNPRNDGYGTMNNFEE